MRRCVATSTFMVLAMLLVTASCSTSVTGSGTPGSTRLRSAGVGTAGPSTSTSPSIDGRQSASSSGSSSAPFVSVPSGICPGRRDAPVTCKVGQTILVGADRPYVTAIRIDKFIDPASPVGSPTGITGRLVAVAETITDRESTSLSSVLIGGTADPVLLVKGSRDAVSSIGFPSDHGITGAKDCPSQTYDSGLEPGQSISLCVIFEVPANATVSDIVYPSDMGIYHFLRSG